MANVSLNPHPQYVSEVLKRNMVEEWLSTEQAAELSGYPHWPATGSHPKTSNPIPAPGRGLSIK
jgi:hypothetical protein